MFKSLITTLVLVGSVTAFANPREEVDAQIKQACSSEIATTGCGDKSFGKGLMKCMHEYKKAHKDFAISDGCRDAKKKMKEERKERKEAKAQAPATQTK